MLITLSPSLSLLRLHGYSVAKPTPLHTILMFVLQYVMVRLRADIPRCASARSARRGRRIITTGIPETDPEKKSTREIDTSTLIT